MSSLGRALDDPALVGARVQARFAEHKARGDQPLRARAAQPAPPQEPSPAEAEADLAQQLTVLRAQLNAALIQSDARVSELESRVEAIAGRAARVIAAAEALAAELDRLSSALPPEVAAHLDGAVERFAARLRSA